MSIAEDRKDMQRTTRDERFFQVVVVQADGSEKIIHPCQSETRSLAFVDFFNECRNRGGRIALAKPLDPIRFPGLYAWLAQATSQRRFA